MKALKALNTARRAGGHGQKNVEQITSLMLRLILIYLFSPAWGLRILDRKKKKRKRRGYVVE